MEENKNTLNFVYDSWLEDKPINNGEKQFNNDYDNNWGNKIHFADFCETIKKNIKKFARKIPLNQGDDPVDE